MNGLNNFSDILKHFTHKQKLLVLIFLLVFTLIVSLGTVFINGYYKSSDELLIITHTQQENIIELNKTVNELQISLLNNSKSCTDSILSIQKKHTLDMLEQQEYVDMMLEKLKEKLKYDITKNRVYNSINVIDDTVQVNSVMMTGPQYNDVDEYIDIINNIQNKIKK